MDINVLDRRKEIYYINRAKMQTEKKKNDNDTDRMKGGKLF